MKTELNTPITVNLGENTIEQIVEIDGQRMFRKEWVDFNFVEYILL